MIRRSLLITLAFLSLASPTVAQLEADLLWGDATLYRDEWGVPHIYAETTRAMAFAFGYAQAEDHLPQMLMAYRAVNGRAAEVAGKSMAESDEFAIRMRHAELAKDALESIDPTTRDLCEGFALGVNTWMLEHLDSAPGWAKAVDPADVLALMHGYLMSMAPFDLADAYRPAKGTPSANAWAAGPKLTDDGSTVLVINPHADYESPYQWYEAHLAAGDYDVAGATLFGLPVILQGHNDSLGWGLSPNNPDIADLYDEGPGAGSPDRVPVKAYYVATPNGIETRYVNQAVTARGPIVAFHDGTALSYKVGGYGEFGALSQLFRMGLAKSMPAFTDALALDQLPSFHVVYADREGNILYRYNAKAGDKADYMLEDEEGNSTDVPVWSKPVSAYDRSLQWDGTLAFDALPMLTNPEAGYVQACGTTPWGVAGDDALSQEDWPGWLVRDLESNRARRIRQLFSTGTRSFHDSQSMLYDLVVPVAAEAVAFLSHAAQENPRFVAQAHPDLVVGLDMLQEWNFLADTNSAAMTYFHLWWTVLQTTYDIPTTSISTLSTLLKTDSPDLRFDALVAASEAARLMRNEFQTMFVPWGEVHTVMRGDRKVGLGGGVSGEPLFMSWDRDYQDGIWPVTSGYGFAMVIRFGEGVEAVSLTPFGASENPESPHYDDQLSLLTERRYKITRFNRTAVEAHARSARGKGVMLNAAQTDNAIYISAPDAIDAHLNVARRFDSELPADIASFSAYLEPVVAPAETPIKIEVMFFVPESVCAAENLRDLAIYGYQPGRGWSYLREQWIEPPNRKFLAAAYQPMVFAVMGPRALRRGDPFDAAIETDAPPVSLARREPTASRSDPSQTEPAAPMDPPPATDEVAMDANAPATDTPAPDLAIARTREPERPERIADDVREPEAGRTIKLLLPEDDAAEASGTEAQIADEVSVDSAATGAGEEADIPEPESAGRVTGSTKSLSELLGRSSTRPRHETFMLAADPDRASPLLVAKELKLRPPVEGAVFHLSMMKTVRAQVAIEKRPPAALPEGLAAFSPVFTVLHAPDTTRGTVAISLQVEEGVCAPSRFGELKLYSFDEAAGWQPVRGHKSTHATRSFSALDFSLRTYAILGPAESLLRAPAQ